MKTEKIEAAERRIRELKLLIHSWSKKKLTFDLDLS